ncbi:MAG TPA: hypothetical protein VKV39_02405 [Candidatus Sulfotelmatobacter sp.]|nr:hypothetical protein [Candidatus Sulfotelmatobacter sp.]
MANEQMDQYGNADRAKAIASIRGNLDQSSPLSPLAGVDPSLTPLTQPQFSMVPPSATPLLQANPVQAVAPASNVGTQLDPSQIAGEQIQRTRALSGQLSGLMDQQRAMGQPQSPANPQGYPTPWTPHFEPVTGVGSFAKDAAKGLLYGLSLTGPGRAVEGAMYERKLAPYELQRANIADRINAINTQEEIEQKPITAMAELAYHQDLIRTKDDLNNIKQQLADEKNKTDAERTDIERQKVELVRQRADQAAIKWRDQFSMQLQNLKLSAKKLDRETARDQLDAMLRDQANRNYAARTAAGQSEKEASLAAVTDIAQAKIDADKWFQRTFGLQPQINPRASVGSQVSNSTVKVTDPRGIVHTFPDQRSADNFKKAAGIK